MELSAVEFLKRLSVLPHRGSTTEEEKKAAGMIAGMLQEMGYRTEEQPFAAPKETLYSGVMVLCLVFLGAALIGQWSPVAGLAVCLLFLFPVVGELLGSEVDFDWFLFKRSSQNIVSNVDNLKKGPLIVVTAHYDTQKGSYLFAPWFLPFVPLYFGLNYLAMFGVIASLLLADQWRGWVQIPCCTLLGVSFVFMAASKWTGRFVNGANDNGSGVAVALAVANRLRAVPELADRFVFLFTGCEEVGERGMKHFMKTYGASLDPKQVIFVNLDNIAGGTLRSQEGEGMLRYYRYDQGLIELAKQVSEQLHYRVVPNKNTLLPTDALIPTRLGYRAITFIGIEEHSGRIPNYHWHTDLFENIDPEALQQVELYIWEYLLALAEKEGRLTRPR
jgi:hypothetical protein